jgi:hypothetical protein
VRSWRRNSLPPCGAGFRDQREVASGATHRSNRNNAGGGW